MSQIIEEARRNEQLGFQVRRLNELVNLYEGMNEWDQYMHPWILQHVFGNYMAVHSARGKEQALGRNDFTPGWRIDGKERSSERLMGVLDEYLTKHDPEYAELKEDLNDQGFAVEEGKIYLQNIDEAIEAASSGRKWEVTDMAAGVFGFLIPKALKPRDYIGLASRHVNNKATAAAQAVQRSVPREGRYARDFSDIAVNLDFITESGLQEGAQAISSVYSFRRLGQLRNAMQQLRPQVAQVLASHEEQYGEVQGKVDAKINELRSALL